MIAFIIFYGKAHGVQAALAFSSEFRHVNIITFDGRDWIMLDFDRTGLLTRKIHCTDGTQLFRSLRVLRDITAVVAVDVGERHKVCWKPFWVRSCNEIVRYASGIDIGFTFNPVHLYKKLLRYDQIRNYTILTAWRRKNGFSDR